MPRRNLMLVLVLVLIPLFTVTRVARAQDDGGDGGGDGAGVNGEAQGAAGVDPADGEAVASGAAGVDPADGEAVASGSAGGAAEPAARGEPRELGAAAAMAPVDDALAGPVASNKDAPASDAAAGSVEKAPAQASGADGQVPGKDAPNDQSKTQSGAGNQSGDANRSGLDSSSVNKQGPDASGANTPASGTDGPNDQSKTQSGAGSQASGGRNAQRVDGGNLPKDANNPFGGASEKSPVAGNGATSGPVVGNLISAANASDKANKGEYTGAAWDAGSTGSGAPNVDGLKQGAAPDWGLSKLDKPSQAGSASQQKSGARQ